MPIRCFLLKKTDLVRESLRRYSMEDRGCPGMDYHDARVTLRTVADERKRPSSPIPEHKKLIDTGVTKDDPRWPTKCDHCDYVFSDKDQYQLFQEVLYRREDTEECMTLRDAPVGAMYWSTYERHGSQESRQHQDRGGGPHLHVKCPPNWWWDVDSPSLGSEDRSGWERTGIPPNITASPSIGVPQQGPGWAWHGWLRDGFLHEVT